MWIKILRYIDYPHGFLEKSISVWISGIKGKDRDLEGKEILN